MERSFQYTIGMDTKRDKIISFFRTEGRMPSYSEIMQLTGYRSKNAVHHFLHKLLEDGVLKKDKSGKLLPKNPFGSVKLLGLVEAGWPSPAEEELVDVMSLDEYLIDNREATYLLRVKGDSMIEAGIQEGDLVLVERNRNPKVGAIVIAEVDGEWTIKYLRKKDGKPYLEPANSRYKPIYPEQTLNVIAVVKGVIRKY